MASAAEVKSTTLTATRTTAFQNRLLSHLIYAFILVVVFWCAAYKASNASMTHDESSSYLNLVAHEPALNLWKCYEDAACWTNANNHLLNTQLMRWSAKIFGTSELALRLPNLLLLLVYLCCVFLIIRDTALGIVEGIFGIALMAFNPFLLDFFALARGYGMGAGLMMLSMYGIWKYYRDNKASSFLLAFGAAAASVFANLTYLAYVMALTGAVVLYTIIPLIRKPRRQLPGIIPLSVAGCLIFLALYFYRPILILIGLGEFDFGAPTLWETWYGLARDSAYGIVWFGEKTVLIIALLFALISGISLIIPWATKTEEEKKKVSYGRFISLLFVLLILFFVLSHVLTGAFYPSGRKAIILIPVVGLLIYFAAHLAFRKKQLIGPITLGVIAVLFISHLYRAFNTHTYREWWYDASTKQMTEYVATTSTSSDKTSLATEWIFHPSTDYYVRTRQLPIDLKPYSKEISVADSVDYYFVHPEHVPKLEPAYVVEKNFEGRLLLKKQ